jgi:hypothetical protein
MAGSSIHIAPIEKSTTHNFFHNAREDKREPSYLLPKEHRQANEINKAEYHTLINLRYNRKRLFKRFIKLVDFVKSC